MGRACRIHPFWLRLGALVATENSRIATSQGLEQSVAPVLCNELKTFGPHRADTAGCVCCHCAIARRHPLPIPFCDQHVESCARFIQACRRMQHCEHHFAQSPICISMVAQSNRPYSLNIISCHKLYSAITNCCSIYRCPFCSEYGE